MQNLSVILSVFIAAAAIIIILLWRIRPQVPQNTDALDKRILEEVKKAEALQVKLDAKETALRSAEANSAAAKAIAEAAVASAAANEITAKQAKNDLEALQRKYGEAQPSIAAAIEQKKAAEQERDGINQRMILAAQKIDALQADLLAATDRSSAAQADADHKRMQIDDLSHMVEIHILELAEERQKLAVALAKQQSDEASANHFKVISQEILDKTLEEAKRGMTELSDSFHKASGAELEKHADKITKTMEPLKAQLVAYDAAVESLKKGTQENYGSLREQLSELQKTERLLHDEAKALTFALSSSPKVKGNYGEMILKQLVEFVGMQDKCHFETQASRETEEGRKIPDLVVSLPGGQKVLVDAKAVMDACVEAQKAQDDHQRALLIKKHCDNVRSRVADLSSKTYFADHQDAVEAVVLFLPAENLYATAMENDAGLTEYAMTRNIILCGPNSLMLLLKVSNQLWRRAAVEKEVKDIQECGTRIYKSACDFVDKFAAVGKKIQSLETEYNGAVGTFEGRLLPAGRRMNTFVSISGSKEIGELEPVKDNVREFKEATKQLAAGTLKLPELVVGAETAELEFSAADK